MTPSQTSCDYLVIGAGAVGMAFVDTLLDQTDATFVIVDDHHQPGGHWNDAYPFVRLHQPSHFYGVASAELGSKTIDTTGWNQGYYELASGSEVQSYFERVMRQRFLPSGRVTYFPMSEYLGERRFRGMLSGQETEVTVAKRVVDSTFYKTSVPSRHTRNFDVQDGAVCEPPNALPRRATAFERFCVLGAGKTAMDAVVWLLDHGVAADDVHWVCPRSSWMINRQVTQGSVEFFEQSIGGFADQMEAIALASSVDDLFDRLEDCGFMLRIDRTARPDMFHYATISPGEVEALRTVEHVIRQGRVASIDASGLEMADGTRVAMPSDTLYVDCTASAVDFKMSDFRPVFEPDLITIQGVRVPNPCLSAAIIAYVEANYDDDETRNRLCQVVPLPDDQNGFVRSTLGNMLNQATWGGEPDLQAFVTDCRLDGFGAVIRDADLSDPTNAKIMEKMGQNLMPAVANLQKLLAAG